MLRTLVLAGVVAGISASVPILLRNDPEALLRLVGRGAADEPVPAVTMAVPRGEAASGRKVRLDADARGHFTADFKLNGRQVPAMVDTGASVVAINMSTARRIGVRLSPSDFTGMVETANGRVRAASVVIDRIAVGRVEFGGVQAVVLEDKALSGTLIGMSFLSRLRRFQVEGGALVLEQ